MGVGPLSSYTQEIGDEICDRLACNDESLSEICRDLGLSERTVWNWVRDVDTFRQNYARARDQQGDHEADGIVELRKKVERGEIAPDVARVMFDAYKWTAGKRKPKVYGDKLTLGGDAENPLTVETVTAHQRAKAMAALLAKQRREISQTVEISKPKSPAGRGYDLDAPAKRNKSPHG